MRSSPLLTPCKEFHASIFIHMSTRAHADIMFRLRLMIVLAPDDRAPSVTPPVTYYALQHHMLEPRLYAAAMMRASVQKRHMLNNALLRVFTRAQERAGARYSCAIAMSRVAALFRWRKRAVTLLRFTQSRCTPASAIVGELFASSLYTPPP